MKRKHMIRACLLLFCLLLCTACRSESKPKETRFSFVSEDSLTIVNAEGQELHFADKVWSGTMPVLDGHFTVDFVPGSTSVQVRFSESFSVRFEPERRAGSRTASCPPAPPAGSSTLRKQCSAA